MLGDRVKHALDIRGGAGNDTEDLARRGLLLLRLCQLAVAPLELLQRLSLALQRIS